MIDCIILAGGLGTRLRKALPGVPKALAPINQKPFLDLLLDRLNASNMISSVTLALCHQADKIIAHYPSLKHSIEPFPLGTGGAICHALTHTNSNPVLVLNGDCYLELSIQEFLEEHLKKSADISIATIELQECKRYGLLSLNGDRIESFAEKEGSGRGWINGGAYLISPSLFSHVPDLHTFSLEREFFPSLLEKKFQLNGFKCRGTFIDIGTSESFLRAQQLLVPSNG